MSLINKVIKYNIVSYVHFFFSKIRITLLEMEYLGTESDTMISRCVKTQIKFTLTLKEDRIFQKDMTSGNLVLKEPMSRHRVMTDVEGQEY